MMLNPRFCKLAGTTYCLIHIFTDVDDVVIDCCAGSGTTLLAANNLGRRAYGFELKKQYVKAFYEQILPRTTQDLFYCAELEEKKTRAKQWTK